jgi:hypothetical protein
MTARPILSINRLGPDTLYRDGRFLLPSDRVTTFLLAPDHEGSSTNGGSDFAAIEYLRLDTPEVWRERATWHLRNSGVERIVAPNERFLRLAAALREEFGIPGISVAEADLFTDKLLMKSALVGSTVRVPRFAPAAAVSDVAAFPTFPAVLKRTDFSGGRGVYIVATRSEAVAAFEAHQGEGEFEIEEYIDGTMYHCDSVVEGGEVRFAAVSRYLAKPGDYHAGGVGGSVLVGDGELRRAILELNTTALGTLGLRNGVTHLELFRTSRDELVFCEVAGRPGGGGIAEYILNAFGIDIHETALWLDAGQGLPDGRAASPQGGTFGCIGLYPSRGASPVIPDLASLAPYGVMAVDVLHSRGEIEPEHCTDYVALFQLRGDTPQDFDEHARALCTLLGITQEITGSDPTPS